MTTHYVSDYENLTGQKPEVEQVPETKVIDAPKKVKPKTATAEVK